jgi:hypothetical protein
MAGPFSGSLGKETSEVAALLAGVVAGIVIRGGGWGNQAKEERCTSLSPNEHSLNADDFRGRGKGRLVDAGGDR